MEPVEWVPVGGVGAEEVCEVGCGGGDGGFVAGCPGSAGGQCGGQHPACRVVCAGAGQADAQGGQVGQPQWPAGLYTERRWSDGCGLPYLRFEMVHVVHELVLGVVLDGRCGSCLV